MEVDLKYANRCNDNWGLSVSCGTTNVEFSRLVEISPRVRSRARGDVWPKTTRSERSSRTRAGLHHPAQIVVDVYQYDAPWRKRKKYFCGLKSVRLPTFGPLWRWRSFFPKQLRSDVREHLAHEAPSPAKDSQPSGVWLGYASCWGRNLRIHPFSVGQDCRS